MKNIFHFTLVLIALSFSFITFSQSLCFDAANDNRYETYGLCMDVGVTDMNGDGHLDIIAVGGDLVSIHLGNGDGTFDPLYSSLPGTNWDMQMVDFDNDNDLDFYTYGFGNCLAVRNLGNGNFEWAGYVGVDLINDQMSEMSVGKVTGDDTYCMVVNDQGGDVFVITTDVDGIPLSSFSVDVLPNPINVTVGDLNGDAIMDFVCSSATSDNVGIYLGQGGEIFTEVIVDAGAAIGIGYAGIEIDDIDGDLDNDLLIGGYGSMYVLKNNGGGNFTSLPDVFMGSYCQGVIAGDWDDDGDNDVAWANQSGGGVTTNLNNGDGTFPGQGNVFYSSNGQSEELIADDFDEDGMIDMIVANGFDRNFAFLKGHGDGSFGSKTLLAGYTSQGLAVADLDNDGDQDVVASNSNIPSYLAISFNNGDGSFEDTQFLPDIPNAGECVTGDFNNDDNIDIAVHSPDGYAIHMGNGNGTFDAWEIYPTSNIGAGGDRTIVIGDFNNDNILDLAGSRPGDDEVNVVMGNGDGSFDLPVILPGAGYPRTLLTQDLNDDNKDDLIVCSNTTDEVWIYFSEGVGAFSAPLVLQTPGYPEGLTSFDANEDGDADLIVGSPNSNTLYTFISNGDGTFEAALTTDIPTGSNSSRLDHADVNNDGHQDILSAMYQIDAAGAFFGNGDGTFQSAITYAVDQAPNRIVAADFNGDGAMDFSTLNSGIFNISVVLNNAAFITADGDLAFCEGEDVVLTASTGYSYSWSNGDITQSITAIENGEFYCAITNQSGDCTLITPTVEVEVFVPVPVTLALDSSVVCLNGFEFYLTGGQPFGGQYTGTGVVANVFNASTAGVGMVTITYTYEDAGGCTNASATDMLQVENCINVDEEVFNLFSAYPTVTSHSFTLEGNLPFNFVVIDVSGRVVKNEKVTTTRSLVQVSDWPVGLYLVRIECEGQYKIFKVEKIN